MSGLVAVVVVFLLLGLGLGGAAYWVYQRKLRRAKAIERGLKMVPILIHLPPPSSDTEAGNRDVREVMREKTAQAGVLYNMISGTAMTGFKSRFYGQRHVALELVAIDGLVHFYAAVPVAFVSTISKAIQTAYPGARLEQVEDHNIFNQEGRLAATLGGEMVLRQSYAYPIATYAQLEKDPMEALLTTVSALEKKDGVGIQIMIRPASPTWSNKSKKMADAIRKGRAQNVSFNAMDIAKAAVKSPDEWRAVERERLGGAPDVSQLKMQEVEAMEEKTKHPAFEVLIRVLVSTQSVERSQQLLRDIATTFALFESPGLNGFKFLPALDIQGLVTAFIFRFFPPELRSNILNSVELATLFHLPDAQFTPTMSVERQRSKQVDGPVHLPTAGLLFGHNEFRGVSKEVRLAPEDRRRHSYILGQTGTGKSTMLENLAFQDMLTGSGFAFIDPHGDSAEKLLAMVPKERAEDIIYFNPSDTEYPLGLNLFEFSEPSQKDFLVQETINMLYKLYDPGKTGIIGPRYEHWYRNAALTLMSDPNGSTFIEIPKVFTHTDYLKAKFKYLRDPTVIDFWTKEMGQTSDYHKSEMLGWFVSKFGAFQNNEMMRNIIGQTKSSFNLRDIMDQKKILIVNLSKGRVGELNSQLLGMIFVIKFQAAAMSRANMPEDQRTDFCLYVDEFQNFSTDSFASILSEARKYRLNLIVANQFIGQLSEEIREAVFGNIGTIVAHRMGPEDAEFMVKQFAPVFDTNDLVNIPNYNAAMRLMIGGLPSQPFTVRDSAPLGTPNLELGMAIKQLSAAKYGHSKAKVESDIMARLSAKGPGKEPAAAPGDKPVDAATAGLPSEVQPGPPAGTPPPPPGPGNIVHPTDVMQPDLQPAPAPVPTPAPQPAPVVQAGPVAVPQMAQPAPAGPQPAPMPQAVINAGMHPDHQVGALQAKADDTAPIPSPPAQQAEAQSQPATPGAIYAPAQAPADPPLPKPGDAFYDQTAEVQPEPPEAVPARMPATTVAGNDPDQSMESGMADMGAPMGAPSIDPQPQAMAATPPPIGAPPVDLPAPGAAPAPAPMGVPQSSYAVPQQMPTSPAVVQQSFSPAPVPPLDDNPNDMAESSPHDAPTTVAPPAYQAPVNVQPAAVAPMPVAPRPVPMPMAPAPAPMPVAPPPPPIPTAPALASAVQAAAAAPPPIGAPPVDLPMQGAAPVPVAAAPIPQPSYSQPAPMPYTPPAVAPMPAVTAAPPPADPSKTLSLSDITGGQTRPPVDLSSIDLIPPGAEPPMPPPQPQAMQAMPSQPMAVTGRPMAPVAPPPPPMPMLGSGMPLEGDPYGNIEILGDMTQPGTEEPTVDASQGPVSGPLANDPNAGIPLTGAELGPQSAYSSAQTAVPKEPRPKPEPPEPEPARTVVAPPAPPPPAPAPAPVVQAPPPAPPQPAPPVPGPVPPPPPPPPAPAPTPQPPAPIPTPAQAPLPTVAPPAPVAPPLPPPVAPAAPPVAPIPAPVVTAAPAPQPAQGQPEDFFNSKEPLIHFVDPSAQAVLDRPDVVEPQKAPDEEDLLLAGLPEGVTIMKQPAEAPAGPTPSPVPLPAPMPPAPPVPTTVPAVPAAPVPAPSAPVPAAPVPAATPATPVTLPTPPVPGGAPLEKMAKEPPPIGAAPVDIGPGKGIPAAPPPPPQPETTPEPKKEAPKPIPKSNASLAKALMTEAPEETTTPETIAPALDGLRAVSAQLEKKPEPAVPAPPAKAGAPANPKPETATPATPKETKAGEATVADATAPAVAKPVDTVKAATPTPGPLPSGAQQIEATEEKIDDLLSMSLIHPDASSGAHHRLPEPMVAMGEDESGVDLEMNANRRQTAGQPPTHPMEHHGLKVIQPTEPIVPPHDEFMKELAEMQREEAAAAAAKAQPQKKGKAQAPAPRPTPPPPAPTPPPKPPTPAPQPQPAPTPTPQPQPPTAPAVIVQHKGEMMAESPAGAPSAPKETEDFSGLPQAESLAADDVAHARAEREAAVAMQRPLPGQELPVVTTGKAPEPTPVPKEEKKPEPPKAEKPKEEKHHMLRRDKPAEHIESKEEEEHNKPTAAMKEQGQMTGKLIMPTADKPKMEAEPQKMEKPKKLAAGEVFVDEHGNVVIGE